MRSVRQHSNFSQLKAHDEQLERLGLLAERYFADDPNTCLLKLRELAESMAQSVASQTGIYTSAAIGDPLLPYSERVDRASPDKPDLIFKREGGGFNRLDKTFNGRLQPVLEAFNDALWAAPPESAQR